MAQTDNITFSGSGNGISPANLTRTIHTGKVIKTLPDGRLQVRLKGIDTRVTNDRLTICHPMIPLFICPIPKIGELVRIVIGDVASPYEERFWFGPVITQAHNLSAQPYIFNAEVVHNADGIYAINLKSPSNSSGLYPDETKPDTLYWLGRGNTDMRQFPDGIELRAGKYKEEDRMARNTNNPGVIGVYNTGDKGAKETATVGLADKFYFVSHKSTLRQSKLGEVTPQLLADAQEQGYSFVKGELLVELATLLIDAIVGHAHGFDGKPALQGNLIQRLQKFPLGDLLNQNFVTV